jgi:hypothetical protein
MNEKISILIEAILKKSTQQELENELKKISSKLPKLNLDTNIKEASQELQKFSQTFVKIPGQMEKLNKEVEVQKQGLGQVLKITRQIKEEADQEGNIRREVTKTITEKTTDLTKQRLELEKINQEQSKYWSNRVKETMTSMTQKPDELIKMSDYYKNMEVESVKLAVIDEKREQTELSYWSKRRKEATEAIAQNNTVLQQMKQYYTQLEQTSARENQRTFNLGTNLTGKTSGFTGVDKESVQKYATEIYGANATVTKFNQTMDKNGKIMSDAVVKVSKNSKEYTEYRMKVDSATKSVNQFGEAINRKTGKDMGIFEQFKVAMERFPIWIASATLVMGTLHQLGKSIDYIHMFDDATVELTKVVELSNSQIVEMKNSAIDLGKELGKSSTEIMKGMAEWGRVTKDVNEIQELTRVATMASNVTSLSVADASKALTTAMIDFNINAKDSIQLLDQWNEIQNNFKTKAEDLSGANSIYSTNRIF